MLRPSERNPRLRLHLCAVAALALAAGACGRAPAESPPSAEAAASDDAGYLAPPALTAAERRGGRLVLGGTAPAGSQVRLASPEGAGYSAMAGDDGKWAISLPAPSTPGMFAFWAEGSGRTLRGEGAVLVTPPPGPAALLLRAGAGAMSLSSGRDRPMVLAVDYDQNGGAAVSGLARPSAAVRLSLDGEAAGFGQADQAGRFAVTATNRTLAPGLRTIEVETPAGRDVARIEVSQVQPLGGAAYRAVRGAGGWRIDWTPPGGGVQTSFVLDRAEARP